MQSPHVDMTLTCFQNEMLRHFWFRFLTNRILVQYTLYNGTDQNLLVCIWAIKLCDFKMDVIKWQLNFGSCNFGLKFST